MRNFFWSLLLLFSLFAHSQYDYQQLMVKDYEEMEQIIKKQIASSRKALKEDNETAAGALAQLKKGLTILFMHPSDGTNSTLVALLKAEILNYAAFWRIMSDMVRDSVHILQSSSYSTPQQASHLYVLENVLSYIRSTNEAEFDQILDFIAKAKVLVSESINSHRLLNASRSPSPSPSSLAAAMLKQRIKARKAKERKEKALEKQRAKEKALEKKHKAKKALKSSKKSNQSNKKSSQ